MTCPRNDRGISCNIIKRNTYNIIRRRLDKLNLHNIPVICMVDRTKKMVELDDDNITINDNKINKIREEQGFGAKVCLGAVCEDEKSADDPLIMIIIKPTEPDFLNLRDISKIESELTNSNNYLIHISLIFLSELEESALYNKCDYYNNESNGWETMTCINHPEKHLTHYLNVLFERYHNQTIFINGNVQNTYFELSIENGIGNDHLLHVIHNHSKRYHNRKLHVSL